jgi:hypothetical protein
MKGLKCLGIIFFILCFAFCKSSTPTQGQVGVTLEYFRASPDTIKSGESSTLQWSIKNPQNAEFVYGYL